jgi:hypothetical protein
MPRSCSGLGLFVRGTDLRFGLIEDLGYQGVDLAADVAHAAELTDLLHPGAAAGDGGLFELVAKRLGDKLAERHALLGGFGLGPSDDAVGEFQRGLHG